MSNRDQAQLKQLRNLVKLARTYAMELRETGSVSIAYQGATAYSTLDGLIADLDQELSLARDERD